MKSARGTVEFIAQGFNPGGRANVYVFSAIGTTEFIAQGFNPGGSARPIAPGDSNNFGHPYGVFPWKIPFNLGLKSRAMISFAPLGLIDGKFPLTRD